MAANRFTKLQVEVLSDPVSTLRFTKQQIDVLGDPIPTTFPKFWAVLILLQRPV